MTPEQKANLATLATYLEAHVPPPEFGMSGFLDVPYDVQPDDDEFEYDEYVPNNLEIYHTCGTSACAVGHGPLAMPDSLTEKGETWNEYSRRMFGCGLYTAFNKFNWMFGYEWAQIDDTPTGAAARIRYFLDKPSRRTYPDPDDFDWSGFGEQDPKYTKLIAPFLKVTA